MRERVCVCVCVCERKSVCERECVCVCGREKERVCVSGFTFDDQVYNIHITVFYDCLHTKMKNNTQLVKPDTQGAKLQISRTMSTFSVSVSLER